MHERDFCQNLRCSSLPGEHETAIRGSRGGGGGETVAPINLRRTGEKNIHGGDSVPFQGRREKLPDSEWEQIVDLFGTVDLPDATKIELPPTLAEWQPTSEETAGFKLQLKLRGRDQEFREALITKLDGNDNDYFEELLDLSEGNFGKHGRHNRGGKTDLDGSIWRVVIDGGPVSAFWWRT